MVVSNAALHWVPDHLQLMGRWLRELPPGAWLAVQVPGNQQAPSHALMQELAASARWRGRLAGVLHHDGAVAEPHEYHDMFTCNGARVEVWETTYQQLLQGADPVLEWIRGAALRPVLAALDPPSRQDFEQEYGALLRRAYPPGPAGTPFPFRRIFMVGRKRTQTAEL